MPTPALDLEGCSFLHFSMFAALDVAERDCDVIVNRSNDMTKAIRDDRSISSNA